MREKPTYVGQSTKIFLLHPSNSWFSDVNFKPDFNLGTLLVPEIYAKHWNKTEFL